MIPQKRKAVSPIGLLSNVKTKKTMKKSIVCAMAGVLLSASAMAQNDNTFQKNNWFVTGGVSTEGFMNTDGYITAAGKLGAGIWINPWLGLKLEGVAGGLHLLDNNSGQVFGGHLTYMARLYGAKTYKPFNLNLALGMGFYHYKTGDVLDKYTYMNTLNGNFGIQAVYNITPQWSIYAEPGLSIQPKYYNPDKKKDAALSGYLTAGITYTFKEQFKGASKTVSAAEMELVQSQLRSMNEENANLRKQVNALEEEKRNRPAAVAPTTPADNKLQDATEYVAFFNINKAYLSDKEAVNLEAYANLIKKYPENKFIITGYADKQTGSAEFNEHLSKLRAEAVYNTLVDKYGVNKNQLTMEYKGGVDTMFRENPRLSRAAIIRMVK